MRWLVLPLFLAFATPAVAAHAAETQAAPSNEPFRAVLMTNASIAAHAASTLSSIAKAPAPSQLPKTNQKLYIEQSKWLKASALKLQSVHGRMQHVLAKGGAAPATEIAQMNMEFVHVREAIETESHRYDATHTRTLTALKSLKKN